jgi:hypothetical protein
MPFLLAASCGGILAYAHEKRHPLALTLLPLIITARLEFTEKLKQRETIVLKTGGGWL